MADTTTPTTFACEYPGCRYTATADRMKNTDAREEANGRYRILCPKHGHQVREQGFRVFRLDETLRRDAERILFFGRFKPRTAMGHAIKKAAQTRNGNGSQSAASAAETPSAPLTREQKRSGNGWKQSAESPELAPAPEVLPAS